MRNVVVLVLVAALSVSAAPPKKAPIPAAPDSVPHEIAMFLGSLSKEGGRQVTFKARAYGLRFFFEEPMGVTVYRFEKGRYVKEVMLRGLTLERAMKRYAQK